MTEKQHFCYECGRDIDYWQFQSYLSLCEPCYEKMFAKSHPVTEEEDDEEDFVLGSEVAEVKKPNTFSALLETYNNYIEASSPKPYNIDFDKLKSVEDLVLLFKVLFEETIIYDNLKGFDEFKHLLKEK